MPRVILDSNALMMPFQFGLNITVELTRLLGRCEIIVPSSIISELSSLSKHRASAKAGLALSKKFRVFQTKEKGDKSIIEAAVALDAAVVTNDTDLLEKLKALGILRIRLRSRSHLVIEGE